MRSGPKISYFTDGGEHGKKKKKEKCTPQCKQKNVCPCPARRSVLYTVPCLPLQGDHIHHCCLLWQHPTLNTGVSVSTLPHWRAVKQRLENATPLAVTFIHRAVKSNPLWTEIISTVSRRISTTCLSPSKSDCSVKTCCSASSSISCFQTERAGGSGGFKGKKVL